MYSEKLQVPSPLRAGRLVAESVAAQEQVVADAIAEAITPLIKRIDDQEQEIDQLKRRLAGD